MKMKLKAVQGLLFQDIKMILVGEKSPTFYLHTIKFNNYDTTFHTI